MDEKKRKLEEEEGDALPNLTTAQLKTLVGMLKPEVQKDLLVQALATHSDIYQAAKQSLNSDVQNRKVFVRGLDMDTTMETVYGVFSKYGTIEDHMIIRDKQTGKSRGFGFVTYTSIESVLKAVEQPSKKIESRMAVCQPAILGSTVATSAPDLASRKIFVANVHPEIDAETILNFFAQFGEIEEGPIGYDKFSKKSRGYAIFVFRTVEGAKNALAQPNKELNGHNLFCKLAGEGHQRHRGPTGGPGSEPAAAQPKVLQQQPTYGYQSSFQEAAAVPSMPYSTTQLPPGTYAAAGGTGGTFYAQPPPGASQYSYSSPSTGAGLPGAAPVLQQVTPLSVSPAASYRPAGILQQQPAYSPAAMRPSAPPQQSPPLPGQPIYAQVYAVPGQQVPGQQVPPQQVTVQQPPGQTYVTTPSNGYAPGTHQAAGFYTRTS